MPTYDFLNTKTDEVEEHFISLSDLDSFQEQNPHLKKQVSAPRIVSGVGSVKADSGMSEVFSKIAEKHPDSPLADRYKSKTNAEIKAKEIVRKHRQRSKK